MPKLTNVFNAVGKTINLARAQTYQIPRKPPLNSLVFEKLPDSKCIPRPKCYPTSKPLRLCTKEELQCMYQCPIPCCDCKPKPTPLTWKQRLVKSLLFTIKFVTVGGLAYYTWSEGLWSDSEHSSCLLNKLLEPKSSQ